MKEPRIWISFLFLALLGSVEASTSLITITETGQSTVTETTTSVYPIIITTSSCSVESTPLTKSCQNGVWSVGSLYYSASCGGISLSGATQIRDYSNIPYSECYQFCTAVSSCSGLYLYTYEGLGAESTYCYLVSGSPTPVTAAASISAIDIFTTNPCAVEMVTSTTRTTETVVLTIDYTTLFTSTVIVSTRTPTPTPSQTRISSPVTSSTTQSSASAVSSSSSVSVKVSSVPSKSSAASSWSSSHTASPNSSSSSASVKASSIPPKGSSSSSLPSSSSSIGIISPSSSPHQPSTSLRSSLVSSQTLQASSTSSTSLLGVIVASQSSSLEMQPSSLRNSAFTKPFEASTSSTVNAQTTSIPGNAPSRIPASADLTTETSYTTVISTVYQCPLTVKDCPFSIKTPSPVTHTIPTATSIYSIHTSTVYETRTHSISVCPPWKEKCQPSDMITSVSTETSEAYTTTVRVPVEAPIPTGAIIDVETSSRDDGVTLTVQVTEVVTVLACPA
ncbi:uncharacterized protein N7483_012737 [Penicillium malachiteum]|uniref:uncharacterized protein n=1 Tax=Penicillium malachiteum TaxID=1324776 RepID=UPI00254971F6|nr:uncharacterized protein N7483_012737 [Penicillium malachiteum]KAJ5715556.1 hypothetical protein N7483_012737 [Penicillium malachiteum]